MNDMNALFQSVLSAPANNASWPPRSYDLASIDDRTAVCISFEEIARPSFSLIQRRVFGTRALHMRRAVP